MDKDLDFKLLGIAKAIKQEKFVVPSNQREYSWIANIQVKEFLTDINNALRTPEKPYFLGTIVLTVSDNAQFEVADGQQRLATTTMVLAGIRDWFRAKGDQDNYKDLETSYLFTFDRKLQDTIPKLTLNVDDNEYFKKKILEPYKHKQEQNVQRSHKLIAQASEHIKQYISAIEAQYGPENAKTVLNDWVLYLEEKAMVVMLSVSNAENAFMMFETLNDRGLKTSQVDLVKNHLFKQSGDRLLEAQKLWSSMKSAIESVSDDDEVTLDFLRAACCIQFGLTTKKDIMTRIRSNTANKSTAIAMLTFLEDLSKNFAAILNPDHPKWNTYTSDVRKSIQVINLFKISQVRPLMLAIAKYFSDKHAGNAFKQIVSWSIRFIVMGMRGGRLDEGYARLANRIYTGEIKNAQQLKAESTKLVISDSEFKTAFESFRISNAKQARYFLRSLEIASSEENAPQFIPNDDIVINLEHIIPSSTQAGWEHLDQQEVAANLSRLGNLALLQADKNAEIGNLPFNKKKEIYSTSSFKLTSEISKKTNWDIKEIENRQKEMALLALNAWPL